MDKICLFLLLIACSSCSVYSDDQPETDYLVLYRRIENQFVNDMKLKYNARAVGGGGGMMKNIESVYLSFQLNGELDIEQSRQIYIEVVTDFLNRINSDEKVRPYLNRYPFTSDDVSIQLSFYVNGRYRPSSQHVALVSMGIGTIKYSIYDPNQGSFGGYRTMYTEPYEKALKIVQNHK